VHLVSFIIRIYHDARSSECQNVTQELYLVVSAISYCYLAMLGYRIGVHCFTALYKNGWLTDSLSRNAYNLAVDVIVSNVRNRISYIFG